MTTTIPWNTVQWNGSGWNGPTFAGDVAATLKILYKTTTIILNWEAREDMDYWQLQVSLYPDFRTTFVDLWLNATDYTFTDGQINNAKRYWRVRPATVSGSPSDTWTEVASYWLNTAFAQDVSLREDEWAFVDPDDTTDKRLFDLYPLFRITRQQIWRSRTRNRLGDMLSEFLTSKDKIDLMFDDQQYIDHPQLDEILRFNTDVRTYFLICRVEGRNGETMPHVWKVEMANDPAFTMVAAGRPDILTGTISFEEV